ncbi:TIGR03086 family metal-binding protein [Pseudonocardia sp. CA-107938]|uniref:TIGR03086 family metal-binding protein n=1 Tax=Pseudonocardia sp. CA-107938 TaxID=3240021 RepID=UPI003D8EAC3E
MHIDSDLRSLHRRALDDVTALLADLSPADLDRPTPCAGWDLRALLAHMVGQNDGFAAAVTDPETTAAAFAPGPPDGWEKSAHALAEALAAAPLDRQVRLAELHPTMRFPLPTVVGIQLIDTVVHGWDVATALGRSYRPDDELLAAAVTITAMIPAEGGRGEPGSAFGPVVTPAPDDEWLGVLAHLGRAA